VRLEVEEDGEPIYLFRPIAGGERRYSREEIFHVPGFGYDGYQGYPLITLHREAIGLGLTQQEFTARFIANGAHISGILKHPGQLSAQAHENLKKSFAAAYTGLANVGRFPLLEEGTDFVPFSMPLKDAEFLASKLFEVGEIARILNMPVYKLKDYSHATYSNVEHLQIEWVTDTIRPWAERWEAASDAELLSEQDQERGFSEFNLRRILRGDLKTTMEAYQVARYSGAVNADEMREDALDLNPIDDPAIGKAYLWPVNMVEAGKPAPKAAEPTPKPAPQRGENAVSGRP
jgi:HK97 family phage portal protein